MFFSKDVNESALAFLLALLGVLYAVPTLVSVGIVSISPPHWYIKMHSEYLEVLEARFRSGQ